MSDFPDTFYRGCREPGYLETSDSQGAHYTRPPVMSAAAFFPYERHIENNKTETSIVWNKADPDALKLYASLEYPRPDHGGIHYGIGKINRVGAENLLIEKNLSQYVSFDESPTDANKYHGNILFDVDYCLRKTGSGKIVKNKSHLREICHCFVINGNQVDFFTIERLEKMFPELSNNL